MTEQQRSYPEKPSFRAVRPPKFLEDLANKLLGLSPQVQVEIFKPAATHEVSADTTIPRKGSIAFVPDWQWVAVMNEEGARNRNITHEFGEHCGIKEGGLVEVIGHDPKLNRLLVRYQTPGNNEVMGTSCPSNTLFFITPEEFNSWTPRFNFRTAFKQEVKNSVSQLLRDE